MVSSSGYRFDLCGGHPALDFANTLSSRHTASPRERLSDYGELVSFAQQSDLLAPAEARKLEAQGRRSPAAAQEVLLGAVRLREALYRIFLSVAEKRVPAAEDLQVLNDWVARLRLGPDGAWTFRPRPDRLDALLGPVVKAALMLFTTPDRARIRVCEAPDCVWLFLDGTKNRSRRWCDMAQCGNRMKARRHYARSQA